MRPLKSFVSPQVGVLGVAVKLSAFEESNQEKEFFLHLQSAPQPCHLASKSMSKERAGFPNELPFLIKPERLVDVVFHCPESAKVYADRVPIGSGECTNHGG